MCYHSPSHSESETDSMPSLIPGSDSDTDSENDLTIRAKWQMDGAATLEDAATKLEAFAQYLRALKAEGWELRAPIDDDYGFCKKTA